MVERYVYNLFEKTNFKTFFNFFYKKYLKSNSKISYDGVIYLNNYLINLFSESKKHKLDIIPDECLNISQSFSDPFTISVSIYNKKTTELLDFSEYNISYILNLEFCPTLKLSNEEALSHILFFYLKDNELL